MSPFFLGDSMKQYEWALVDKSKGSWQATFENRPIGDVRSSQKIAFSDLPDDAELNIIGTHYVIRQPYNIRRNRRK